MRFSGGISETCVFWGIFFPMLGILPETRHFCAGILCPMEYKYEKKDSAGSRCLNCGKPILSYGRVDRKYCCPACKNRYNNQHRSSPGQERVKIIRTLDSNREILYKLLKLGISSIDRVSMAHLGFNPEYATSCHRVGTRVIYGCFDMSYEQTPTRFWRIRQTLLDDGEAGKPGGRSGKDGENGLRRLSSPVSEGL